MRRFNRVLMRSDVPVDPVADSVLGWLAIVDPASEKLTLDGQFPEAQVGNDCDGSEEEEDGPGTRVAETRKARGKQERKSGHKRVKGGRARK